MEAGSPSLGASVDEVRISKTSLVRSAQEVGYNATSYIHKPLSLCSNTSLTSEPP